MESSFELEEKAEKAFNAFERGVVKSEQYISEAKNLSVSSRKKVEELELSLNTLRDELAEDAQGKSDAFYKFQEKHRLIVYGSCAGACIGTMWSMGTICAACYATAATILESKLDEYRGQKNQMLEDVGKVLDQIDELLKKVASIAMGLDELDTDMRSVGWLVTEARK